jgi:transposase
VPRKKLEVRKITDVLRLNEHGFSQREIAESLGCARSTVGDTLCRAKAVGLTYAAAGELSEAELYARLYPGNTGSFRRRTEPDYEFLHREIRRPGVTLQQLWVLCRDRHNTHYADVWIMPTSDRKAWSVPVPALLQVGII